MDEMDRVTVIAPVNIAVIKYWGKRDEKLILPINDSVSATLDTSIMCAKTSVCFRQEFTENEIWLNGVKTSFSNPRLVNVLDKIKKIATAQRSVDDAVLSWKVRVCSENNFPTAAGLASSAAGYACLVTALAKLYKINTDVSVLARIGSGSACRSVFGGFVRWHAGVNADGSDSIATQIADSTHWPEMKALILVVSDIKKHTSSTIGMMNSVNTSDLLKYRAKYTVPRRTEEISEAILKKDFAKFAELTMKDSNQFHAVCLDTYPPCVYMTDVSHKVVEIIHAYNDMCGELKVAYTFDAGPNACLYLLDKEVPTVLKLIKYLFPTSNHDFVIGLGDVDGGDSKFLKSFPIQPQAKDIIKYVIHTKVGKGPEVVTSHLLDKKGSPLNLK
ncbi:PREDICTED: diphosphomevalonate decarboxylase [Papilio polytes]|uniref:diphosphomevalonate decarboxylase n=1 Tax=Papilio polytes TaxID=76194 RepID=UPI0006767242|nr:PREDICTED: diphosphomevalonate decarboxylase [Papilio polytes]